MIVVFVGLLGLVIGSFLNVVIHRVPLRKSVAWPASHCPVCGEPIAPKDNVPLLSYVLLRGRCRSCGTRIPMRYPVVEGLTGLLFAAAAYEFGVGLRLIWALALISTLVALAGIDLEHRLLPNVIVGPATVVGFALSVLGNPGDWFSYLLSAGAVSGGLLALALTYRGGMGMGDVKMGGMLGAFLGPYAALTVFLGALGGSFVGLALLATGRASRRSALPFGTFLALGGITTLFVGPELWRSYLGLVGTG